MHCQLNLHGFRLLHVTSGWQPSCPTVRPGTNGWCTKHKNACEDQLLAPEDSTHDACMYRHLQSVSSYATLLISTL